MACGTHVFIPKFVPDDMLDAIEKHGVNRAMMVPAMIALMLQANAAAKKQRDLTSLQNV
jgi:non-ribosomal peptide synthetase component E (peptide arylation enzyme)